MGKGLLKVLDDGHLRMTELWGFGRIFLVAVFFHLLHLHHIHTASRAQGQWARFSALHGLLALDSHAIIYCTFYIGIRATTYSNRAYR